MKYLGDTSALVRLYRRQTSQQWRDAADRGLIMISEPALAETLTFADAKHYLQVERDFKKLYPWAGVPDGIWDLVANVRRELVGPSAYKRSPSPTSSSQRRQSASN